MIWALAAGLVLLGLLWLMTRSQLAQTKARLSTLARKEEEEARVGSILDRRFQEVLEHCGSAVLVLDSSLQVLLANGEARHLLGHEAVGKPLIQAVLSDELQAEARKCLREGQPSQLELSDVGPESRILLAAIYPRGEAGEAYVFLRDVTEVRRLERVRRDFVANVSHELRTPLASMRAMAETLESGAIEDAKTSKRFLGTIIAESDRLARIAEDLLTLSRAESVEPLRERFDLSALLDEVGSRFAATAKKRQVKLETAIPRELEIVASQEQIREAVSNLVDNALKYTGENGSVTLSASKEAGRIEISVADTGIGILQEDISRIFERFYRVDKARSRRTGGTGLGLSIVKHIAESHGGSVHVQSEFNRGSTFTLVLPEEPPAANRSLFEVNP